jgi:radical SAM superfamily enzyme YgiQ (UPF0313 family)
LRVCLINPPSPFLLDDRVFPTLGVVQVASVLEEHGHDVHVEDLSGRVDYRSGMIQTAESGWDMYGLTATTPQFPAAIDILSLIRDHDPGKRVMIGGPHATVMPESCTTFDVVVRGDGERACLTALDESSPRVIDEATNTTKGTLDWHWPARHLIDMDTYKFSMNGVKGTSMMLSQGCPYNCSFCCGRTVPYYRRVRVRNIDDVVAEMRALQETYGIQAVMAFDDEVNLLNEPLLEFCQKIRPLGMKFRAFVKANLFNDVQAEAMANAGFVEVCTGVESGDNRILGIIDKQTTRDINKRFVHLARKHGMRAKAFCSLGHPGETSESCDNLKSWIIEAEPDDFDVTVITIYPGTPIWEGKQYVGEKDGHPIYQYVKASRKPQEDGATLFFTGVDYSKEFAFYKGRPHEYVSHVWTPDLSKDDLVRHRDQIEDDARKALGIPYPKRHSGDQYEHSMGQGLSQQDSRNVNG